LLFAVGAAGTSPAARCRSLEARDVPELDLAVIFTAGNYGQGLWNRERDDLVGGMIIPAITSPHS
jgi:hypothetical protein